LFFRVFAGAQTGLPARVSNPLSGKIAAKKRFLEKIAFFSGKKLELLRRHA
jgi:hypothetical protein